MTILIRAIGLVIVIAFGITFSVTILALIGKLTIAEPYLKSLFDSLILELISAGFFLFSILYKEESSSRKFAELRKTVAKQDGVPVKEVTLESIQTRLASSGLRKEWARDYGAIIYWHNWYAQKLFNYKGLTLGFQPVNPRSEGRLHVCRTIRGCYKGFSIWEAKNGEQSYSQVVVFHSEFEFEGDGQLKAICTNIVVRKKLVKFSYGPFTCYRMRFFKREGTTLYGKMMLVKNGNGKGQESEVGDIVMELD